MGPTAVKVVVTGPFAAGKTTFIGSLSGIPPVTTEKAVTDDTRRVKGFTTVSMDFGKLVFGEGDDGLALYLFGTPGQERFDFMWDVLSQGMLGYVVMVDVTRETSVKEAARIIEHFRGLSDVPFVIGANKAAARPRAMADLGARLGIGEERRIVPCEAFDRDSSKAVLLALLHEVLAAMEDEAGCATAPVG